MGLVLTLGDCLYSKVLARLTLWGFPFRVVRKSIMVLVHIEFMNRFCWSSKISWLWSRLVHSPNIFIYRNRPRCRHDVEKYSVELGLESDMGHVINPNTPSTSLLLIKIVSIKITMAGLWRFQLLAIHDDSSQMYCVKGAMPIQVLFGILWQCKFYAVDGVTISALCIVILQNWHHIKTETVSLFLKILHPSDVTLQ